MAELQQHFYASVFSFKSPIFIAVTHILLLLLVISDVSYAFLLSLLLLFGPFQCYHHHPFYVLLRAAVNMNIWIMSLISMFPPLGAAAAAAAALAGRRSSRSRRRHRRGRRRRERRRRERGVRGREWRAFRLLFRFTLQRRRRRRRRRLQSSRPISLCVHLA